MRKIIQVFFCTFTQNNVCFILNFEKNIFFHSLSIDLARYLVVAIWAEVCGAPINIMKNRLKSIFRPTASRRIAIHIISSQWYTHVQYDIKIRQQDTYNTSIKFLFFLEFSIQNTIIISLIFWVFFYIVEKCKIFYTY